MARIILLILVFCLSSQPVMAQSKEESFADIIVRVVNSLDKQLQEKYGIAIRHIPVIVTTPVNLNNFSQTNALARQLGQEVITQLVQRNYKVEEIRHAKEITSFIDIGEFILSRSSVVNKTYDIGFVVAGTYTPTGTGIRYTAEIINVNDSSIAAMESVTLPFTKEIEILIMQQNTTTPKQKAVDYNVTPPLATPSKVATELLIIPNDIY